MQTQTEVDDFYRLFKPLDGVQPCYCSVLLNPPHIQHEITLEGWLLVTGSAEYLLIQPSVAYDPGLTKIAIRFADVISITPTFPPEPYHAQATSVNDNADLDVERDGILTRDIDGKQVYLKI